MSSRVKDIVIVANNDWHDLWFQRQQFACGFALRGFKVFYLNRALQRWPTINHFKRRFFLFGKKIIHNKNTIPPNIRVITPFWLPPFEILRPINRKLIQITISSYRLDVQSPWLITYIPSYNTIDLIRIIKPYKVAYINVHNYDEDIVISDLLKAEKELVKQADLLFGDSNYNMERLSRLSPGKQVFPSLPGVNYNLFRRAFRGDEFRRCKTIYYFGGIGPHLDLSLYGALASTYKVVFVGIVAPGVYNQIPAQIEIRPPVANSALPDVLKEADILTIFYKDSPYIRGVIPAKFFECLATGKPVLVSGLSEAKPYLDVVYDVQGSEQIAREVIKNLSETETEYRLRRQDEIAKEADWTRRFESFASKLGL